MSGAWLSFARPFWLLALLPLAFFAWRRWSAPAFGTPWQAVVDAHLLPHLLDATGPRARLSFIALVVAWSCAVLALAGPQLPTAAQAGAAQRAALHVLVVDLSPDAAPRLERAKAKLNGLLRALHGAEVALIVYAEEPYLVVPPTGDADVVARFIPELAADAVPLAGNRPDRALSMAADLLARSPTLKRSIILVSGSSPRASAPPALDGTRLFVLQGDAEADPALAAAARSSGGMLQQIRSDDGDVQRLAAALDTTGRADAKRASSAATDIGFWLLLPLLPLAALRLSRGLYAWLPLLLCAGLAAPPAEAARLADIEAKRRFDQGRHDDASARFADARWRAVAHYRAGRYAEMVRLLEGRDDPDSHYNRGNALAKLGFLQDALAAYEASLRLRPDDADTIHNRDLMRRLLNSNRGQGAGGAGGSGGATERDAAQAAEQWLRSVPDEPATLLRRKLQLEHRRRADGQAGRAW